MSLPPLPTPAVRWINDLPLLDGGVVKAATYYTNAQVLQLQRDTVEACAALIEPLEAWRMIDEKAYLIGIGLASCIRSLLKELS